MSNGESNHTKTGMEKKRLREALETTDEVMRETANQWARERARIFYTLDIEQYDVAKKEERADGDTIQLLFVFPMHEKGRSTQTIAKFPAMVSNFKRCMEYAFHIRATIEVCVEGQPILNTSVTRSSGELAKWDATHFAICNMDVTPHNGEQDWAVEFAFHKDGVLKNVTFTHDPAHCKTLLNFMHQQAVAIQETRILRMASLMPKRATHAARAAPVGGKRRNVAHTRRDVMIEETN